MLKPAYTISPQAWMSAAPTRAVMNALGQEQALFVGGCVRNTLLGLPEGDIDIATTWTPEQATQRLQAAGIKVIPTGVDHGTVTAVVDGRPFEITTLRRDVSTDGRRAVVAFTADWREDAQRRDFTMNTLLADMEGNIYDPTDKGFAHLKAGRVIFVGDPAQRIAEDYLRILRFFRFHAGYGRGEPDAAALAACREAAEKIGQLSRERITQEFLRILMMGDPAPHLALMFANKALADLPHGDYRPEILSRMAALQTEHGLPDETARLVVLAGFKENHRAALEHYLVLSSRQKKDFAAMIAALDLPAKTAIYRHGDAGRQAVLLVAARGIASVDPAVDWQPPAFPVNGEDVKALGIAPGPAMGRILSAVEEWWLAQGLVPDRKSCLDKLRELAQ